VRVVSVTSDQPDDALGDGRTTDDALFGPSGACLRAERGAVGGAQRTYTITLEARDASGNVTRQDVHVVVPHDQRDRCPTAEAEALSEEQVEALCVFPEVPGVTEPVELPAAVAPEPVDAGVLTSRPARIHGGCAVGGAGPREPWLVAAVLGLALARRRRAVR
jgi:MYXO-CTERM domain-containing protein